jgi:hypothetical protein
MGAILTAIDTDTEVRPVFELYLSHTSGGEHSTDPRNQFHETAIRDARIATDWAQREPAAASARLGLVARLRLAFNGGPSVTTEACSCPA